MGKMISLFVKDQLSIEELKSILRDLIGHDFLPYIHDGFTNHITNLLGVEINLFSDHGLENDMGINFTDYRYEIDFELSREYINNEYATRIFQLLPFVFSEQLDMVDWIIVENLQKLISSKDKGRGVSMGSEE